MTSQSTATTRLHITPLNPELLPLVLSTSISSLATDISFHNIPTFPENNYGYVTLPAMEADKIKKKLDGSILKGRKLRVDSARPKKRPADGTDGLNTASSENQSTKKSKKQKTEEDVLDGYELSPTREVKRGWTESSNDKTERRKKEKKTKEKEKKSKPQSKSKYTEKPECLFRTRVPPNRTATEDEKSNKPFKKKVSPESVVHEFSQTMTHPTFVRTSDGGNSLTSTFEDGKGWVDESGNLKEPVTERLRKEKYRPGQVADHRERPKAKAKPSSMVQNPSKDRSKREDEELKAVESSDSGDWTSSSGSSSESDGSDLDSASSPGEVDVTTSNKQQQSTPDSSEENKSEPNETKKPTGEKLQQQQTEIHPLEALFKKPAGHQMLDPTPPTQFSFFGQGDVNSDEELEKAAPEKLEPLTPFSKRDMQDRGLRSAAPTPDTSQVARIINWSTSSTPGGEMPAYSNSPVPKLGSDPKQQSDFAKWFWDNRGDNNRAWKKRRRDAAKEQRQRENRRKGMKGKS